MKTYTSKLRISFISLQRSNKKLISMENRGSPAPLGDNTNTTNGGNQNRRAIIVFTL
jgi:hypothetical protein